MEKMWQVAYADGRLDAYENHLIGKTAELLYRAVRDRVVLSGT